MVKNSKIDNDEINLIELTYIIWKGKWKIAAAVVISYIAVISYQSNQTNDFTAITEIKPISSLLLKKYSSFNNLITSSSAPIITTDANANIAITNDNTTNLVGVIPKITRESFFNIYIDILQDRSLIQDGIRKFNLLEASQYSDEQEYNEAIIKLASSVKILTPLISKEKNGKLENSYHTIEFVYDDVEKWISVLKYLDEVINKLVKKTLLMEYNNLLLSLKEKKKYELEDISTKINNNLIDYEREMSDHLSYLKEQSEIAKKLGIAKSTVEVQTFGNQNALLSNIQTDSPFYLRGYEAIDKEIELIESRNNKKAFIQGLFDLEKKKRAIEQDQIIERTKLAISSVLLLDNDKFSAATIDAITTKFEYKNNKNNKKSRLLAIAIGLIVGVFYVIITNAFQLNRVISKKD